MAEFCTPFPQGFNATLFVPAVSAINDMSLQDPFRQGVQTGGVVFPRGEVTSPDDEFGRVFIPGNLARTEAGVKSRIFNGRDENIVETATKFCDKGGQFYAAPLLTVPDLLKPVIPFIIHFTENDVLIPVCHEGLNRSQLMFLAMHAVSSACGVSPCISLPHGADSGFDPYPLREVYDQENQYEYSHGVILPRGTPGDWLHDSFHRTFGLDKQERVGGHEYRSSGMSFLNADDRDATPTLYEELSQNRLNQRRKMDTLLFSPEVLRNRRKHAKGKVIIFAFARAAGIMMRRILEHTRENTEDICIVALPWEDNISRTGGLADIEAARVRGEELTRDDLSVAKHRQVFGLYCSLLSGMKRRVAAAAATAAAVAAARPLSDLPELVSLMNTIDDVVRASAGAAYADKLINIKSALETSTSVGELNAKKLPTAETIPDVAGNPDMETDVIRCMQALWPIQDTRLRNSLVSQLYGAFSYAFSYEFAYANPGKPNPGKRRTGGRRSASSHRMPKSKCTKSRSRQRRRSRSRPYLDFLKLKLARPALRRHSMKRGTPSRNTKRRRSRSRSKRSKSR